MFTEQWIISAFPANTHKYTLTEEQARTNKEHYSRCVCRAEKVQGGFESCVFLSLFLWHIKKDLSNGKQFVFCFKML